MAREEGKKVVASYLPASLVERLDALVAAEGLKSRSAAIRRILDEYLGGSGTLKEETAQDQEEVEWPKMF